MSSASRGPALRTLTLAGLAAFPALALTCTDGEDAGSPAGPVESITAPLITTTGVAADSYVSSGSRSTNFGSSTTVRSDAGDGGSIYHGYLRFAVGDVGTITRATLRLWVSNGSTGPYTVRRVSSTTWDETTIDWNNKPVADGAVVATLGPIASSTWLDIDVTSLARRNTTVTLAFLPGTSDGLALNSRNASSNGPQLVIDDGVADPPQSTEPDLKVAFVGDTADGSNYQSVLNLAMQEGAQALVVAGDLTYDSDPAGWWASTEGVVGQSFPVFLARGNHDDSSWSGFLAEASNHLGGATRVAGPHSAAYKTIFRGLNIVSIRKGDTGTTINNLFGGDGHLWKVCAWHQNQNRMQVGGKGDEMGWGVYEACRRKGAIIITGHEHSYHRTRTMTNIQTQTIDSGCSAGSSLCVGPGRTFVNVVGTGGTGLRAQVRCAPTSSTVPFPSLNTSDASCPIWASIYTTNQGARFGVQFITFNVDGNPRKARGYFKNIAGQTMDTFDIFAD